MKHILACILLISLHISAFGQKDSIHPAQKAAVNNGLNPESNVLVVVNGSVLGNMKSLGADIRRIPNDMIESIDVLKGFKATDKYGEKGKDGAIEIFLKKEFSIEDIKENGNDKTFQKVEIEGSFPGGDAAWRNFLVKNLKAEIPAERFAPSGHYTVVAQFIIDREGNISDVKALTNHGFGMEEEVIRVISKGPKWTPASQGGRLVKAFRKQPITFAVINEVELSTYSIKAGIPTIVELNSGILTDDQLEVTVNKGTVVLEGNGKYKITAPEAGLILFTVKVKPTKKKKGYELGTVAIKVQ